MNPTMPKCPVHEDALKNQTDPESCANLRALDNFKCIAPGCKKSVISLTATMPAILSQTFVTTDDIPRMCMDETTYSRYMDAKNPAWKSDPKNDLAKNIAMCGVAERIFIKKEVIPGVNDACPV